MLIWLSLLPSCAASPDLRAMSGVKQSKRMQKRGKRVMAADKRMSLQELTKRIGTEEQCRQHLFEQRWPGGFVCPKCGARKCCQLSDGTLQCAACRHRISVTAGTVLHRSPLRYLPRFSRQLFRWVLLPLFPCSFGAGLFRRLPLAAALSAAG